MKSLLVVFLLSFASLLAAPAQVITIVAPTNDPAMSIPGGSTFNLGETLAVPTNGFATLKSLLAPNGFLRIRTKGISYDYYNDSVGFTIAGPATVQVIQYSNTINPVTLATFDVQPSPFPPNKALTVGAYSGNVQVTMQMSTDLVNWTPAVNAQIYTNSPDARFFRIQLVTNVAP